MKEVKYSKRKIKKYGKKFKQKKRLKFRNQFFYFRNIIVWNITVFPCLIKHFLNS